MAVQESTDRRRLRGMRTRQAILAHAARVGSAEGLEAVSLQRLATDLGMSKSGLFAHFGSKEELHMATIDAAARIVAMCSSSLEPKWANSPLLLMPRSVARRCRETASRPSAEPTRAAWARIACLVRMPRRRRRSVDS